MKSKNYLSVLIVALVFSMGHLYGQNTGCNAPTGMSATNVAVTTATLSWNAVSGAIIYNVRYRVSPAPNNLWLTVTTTTPTINLTNLVSNSTYEYQVQTGCSGLNGGVTLSAFSVISYFTTLASGNSCAVPTGLATVNITTTSAKVKWNTTGASSYKLRYRAVGTSTWINKSTTGLFKNLTGLTAATAYQWQVRSVCIAPSGVIVYSAFSPISTFQTIGANTCAVPTGLNTTVGGVNSITLGWNSTGAMSYNVRYRSTNTATWISTTSNTNSKVLTGLPVNTAYEWQVQSVCAVNGAVILSAWSASSYFTSLSPIMVKPNPANDRLMVTFYDISTTNLSYTVRDLFGVTYLQNSVTSNSENNQFEINTSGLKNGFYYLELNSADGIKTQKFCVQH